MKKLASILLVLAIALLLALSAYATSADAASPAATGTVVKTIYYDNGCYAVIVITEGSSTRATKSGAKGYNFYNANGVLLWNVEITGTFTYDGSTSSCTNVTKSTKIYDGNWKVTAESCSKSGNKAYGDFTVKRYTLLVPVQTEVVNLVLACSPSGVLS